MYNLEIAERNGDVVTAVFYEQNRIAVGDMLKVEEKTGAITEEKYALITAIDIVSNNQGKLIQADLNLYGGSEKNSLHTEFGSQKKFCVVYPHQAVSMLNHLISQRFRAAEGARNILNLLRY